MTTGTSTAAGFGADGARKRHVVEAVIPARIGEGIVDARRLGAQRRSATSARKFAAGEERLPHRRCRARRRRDRKKTAAGRDPDHRKTVESALLAERRRDRGRAAGSGAPTGRRAPARRASPRPCASRSKRRGLSGPTCTRSSTLVRKASCRPSPSAGHCHLDGEEGRVLDLDPDPLDRRDEHISVGVLAQDGREELDERRPADRRADVVPRAVGGDAHVDLAAIGGIPAFHAAEVPERDGPSELTSRESSWLRTGTADGSGCQNRS